MGFGKESLICFKLKIRDSLIQVATPVPVCTKSPQIFHALRKETPVLGGVHGGNSTDTLMGL